MGGEAVRMPPAVPARIDSIVVLGCKVPQGAPRGAILRRAETAARAFHESPVRVVASGGQRWRGVAEADALRGLLVGLGVPAGAVVRELWSLSTVENAWYSSKLLREALLERPLLVTCDWHMPRALADFAACGVPARPCAAVSPEERPLLRRRREALERVRRWVDRVSQPLWFGP
jgi:uncharacterized SAM-binding protein YcdF (DUF218 family)